MQRIKTDIEYSKFNFSDKVNDILSKEFQNSRSWNVIKQNLQTLIDNCLDKKEKAIHAMSLYAMIEFEKINKGDE
jgi:hypothetical protein